MSNNTNHSLLERALDLGDQESWTELHGMYKDFVYYSLRKLNTKQEDLEDISQQIFLRLTKELVAYNREKGKFRSWFRQLIHFTAINHFRKKSAQFNRDNSFFDKESTLLSLTESEIDNRIDEEWRNFILEEALKRVSKTRLGKSLTVFNLVKEGKTTEEIVAITGLKTNSVYTLKKRVKEVLTKEVASVMRDLEA